MRPRAPADERRSLNRAMTADYGTGHPSGAHIATVRPTCAVTSSRDRASGLDRGVFVQVAERHVDVGDVQLSIAEAGAGGRPLLLVHGFTGAKEDFTPWLDRLADIGWHAVALDLRGHGGGSKPTPQDPPSLHTPAPDGPDPAGAPGWGPVRPRR